MIEQEEANLINADRIKQAALTQYRLEAIGVSVRVAHYDGDSSSPTEYTLTHGNVTAVGPTLNLALLEFVERLLKTDGRLEQLTESIALLRETTDASIKHLASHVTQALQFQVDREQGLHQIIDALFQIGEPGDTKSNLWASYQRLKGSQAQA